MEFGDFIKICENGDMVAVNLAIKDIESENNGPFISKIQYWDVGFRSACMKGHLDVINLMIRKGANDWNIGMLFACNGGHLNVINLMIEKGANHWNSGLYYACNGGHLNSVNMMIEKGANNWNYGLYGACSNGHLNIIKLMIEKGADNWNGGLDGACFGGRMDIAKMMIEYGANNLTNMFRYYFHKINSDIVNIIVKKGISLKSYFEYPKDKKEIVKLCELGLSIDMLKDIDGSDILVKDIEGRRYTVKHVLNSCLISDLTEIVNKYVIN